MQNLNSENVKKVRVKLFCRKSFVLRHLYKFSGLGILTQGCTLLNFYFFVNLERICWKFAQWCLFLHLHLVTDKFNREQGIRIRRALFLFISPELDWFRRHKLWRLTSKGKRRQYSEVHPPFEKSDGHFSSSYSYNTDPRPWTEYNEIDIVLCITCCWKCSPRISLTIGLFCWHWFCPHCWSIAMSNLQLRPKIGFAYSLRHGF